MPTSQVWLQLALYLGLLAALAWPMGAWLAAVAEGRLPRWLTPLVKLESLLYRAGGIDAAESSPGSATRSHCCCSTSSACSLVYALQRCRACCRSIPTSLAAVDPEVGVQHRGELRHQHELAGLRRRDDDELPHADARRSTVQNFVSAATGMAVLVALIRGFARTHADDDRQLLGRPDAHARSTSCCRCRSCSRSCSSRRACVQTFDAVRDALRTLARRRRRSRTTRTARRSTEQAHRRSARPRRRSRSSSSAPTAAASSTSTRRTRSRTRRRSRTSSRCSRSC